VGSTGCTADEAANQLPPEVADALWRAAQEALLNVERHAHAHTVSLTLKVTSGEVVLEVHDDGVGIPADAESRPAHYGLRGLRERAEGLGGAFRIMSGNPKSTLIQLGFTHRHPNMKALRLLLAEDQTLMRQGLKTLLETEPDFRVTGEAADGKEAVKLALQLRPDIILMDVQMPRKNGVDATRGSAGNGRQLKVIILDVQSR
jgi:hypothetical protein